MPELPEVETIKNDLFPRIKGRCIVSVALLSRELVQHLSPVEFAQRLENQVITGLARRGKFLLFQLSSRDTLIMHLRMTGSLLLRQARYRPDPYTRAVFHLDEEGELRFCDRRKLGKMWLLTESQGFPGKLGPEPLEPGFTPAVLSQLLRQHNVPVKALLCDQSFIAGIGNMYADEALFIARLHPLKKSSSLSPEEIRLLHQAIQQVLWKGIKNKGASVDTYRRPDGESGRAQEEFLVAHRSGHLCYNCGAAIQRIALRGRGTYFCPCCQKDS